VKPRMPPSSSICIQFGEHRSPLLNRLPACYTESGRMSTKKRPYYILVCLS
jgi:hypothetical protein